MRWVIFFKLLFLFIATLASAASVVPHDVEYYKHETPKSTLIYTKEHLPFAKHTATKAKELIRDYEDLFSWELDETLYIGLISGHNQIANGFSSQWPQNRQINYVGGTELIDRFSSTSWLDTLLYHESAHNYQMNVKASRFSQFMHSIFGNGVFFLPYLTVPNILENSFLLEGNAVLNESWHGNGGRLYNGRYKAQTIIQAKAGNITPQKSYNYSLEFPYYGDIWYIHGGFYNLFLAQKYGIKNLNSYFKYNSEKFFWPYFTNRSMRNAIGVTFENSLKDFTTHYKELAQDFTTLQADTLLHSQFFHQLNADKEEIYFLINESAVSTPKLVRINKDTKKIDLDSDPWRHGKVIKKEGKYFTQASAHSSVFKISQGLYDNWGSLKDETASKMVQAYLSDGRAVYFDVNSSYMQAQLYVGTTFYAQVNSSVYKDQDDNLYYFKQDAKTRTLYKNKEPLFSYEGYYGIVSDIDSKGALYFIANSELGATLYRFYKGKFTRALLADNIVEAKLCNDQEVFVATIGEEAYHYSFSTLEEIDQTPFETKLFFEDLELSKKEHSPEIELTLKNEYSALAELHYSGTDLFFGTTEDSFIANMNLRFADPLEQNSAAFYLLHDENNTSLAGINYTNEKYLLHYSLSAYKVLDHEKTRRARDAGLIAQLSLPLYRSGYNTVNTSALFYQDYELQDREVLEYSFGLFRSYQYGLSLYPNFLHSLRVYYSQLKENDLYGFSYMLKHDLPFEFYLGIEAKKSYAKKEDVSAVYGVKVSNSSNVESSDIIMPSIDNSRFFQEAAYVGVDLKKVINLSSYWFTFPLSLQRETLYSKYRYYELLDFTQKTHNVQEFTLGGTLHTVLLNKNIFPISAEYIYNDASELIQDRHKIKFYINLGF